MRKWNNEENLSMSSSSTSSSPPDPGERKILTTDSNKRYSDTLRENYGRDPNLYPDDFGAIPEKEKLLPILLNEVMSVPKKEYQALARRSNPLAHYDDVPPPRPVSHNSEYYASESDVDEMDTKTDYTDPEPDPEAIIDQITPLNGAEVDLRRMKHGPNNLTKEDEDANSWFWFLLRAPCHPVSVLMILLVAACGVFEEWMTVGALTIVIMIATGLQIYAMRKTLMVFVNRLKFLTMKKITTIRSDMHNGRVIEQKIPAKDLVPGDYIRLFPGDVVPADVEVILPKNLEIQENALTGEENSVKTFPDAAELRKRRRDNRRKIRRSLMGMAKFVRNTVRSTAPKPEVDPELGEDKEMNELTKKKKRFALMGSAVLSGTALCRVVFTGMNTCLASMVNNLKGKDKERGFLFWIKVAIFIVFVVEISMIPPTVLLLGILSRDWYTGFMLAFPLAFAVLPKYACTMVKATMAKYSLQMKFINCALKNLDTLLKLASINILCIGRTGILTMNQVSLSRAVSWNNSRSYAPLFLGYLNAFFTPLKTSSLDDVIEEKFKCSIMTADPSPKMPPSASSSCSPRPSTSTSPPPTEEEFDGKPEFLMVATFDITNKLRFIAEIPFDGIRRRVSIILEETGVYHPEAVMICKGGVQELVELCASVVDPRMDHEVYVNHLFYSFFRRKLATLEFSREHRLKIRQIAEKLTGEGLQVIAVAHKVFPYQSGSTRTFTKNDERDLTFCGFLAFSDGIRYDARCPINTLLVNGVKIKLLSGDIPQSCKKIAMATQIPSDNIIVGEDLNLFHTQGVVQQSHIFTKLLPVQKVIIVKSLKNSDDKVGLVGTSISDVEALKEATVGIAVFGGSPICALNADMIIPDFDLNFVVKGIMIGRKVFGKIMKYLITSFSCSLGLIMSILIASAWLPFLPMSTLHFILLTLVFDVAQITLLWDPVDESFLKTPHCLRVKSVVKYILLLGTLLCAFNVFTHIFMYFHMGIQSLEDDVIQFQTASFISTLFIQALLPAGLHFWKMDFVDRFSCPSWLIMTLPLILIGIFLPFIPTVNGFFGLTEVSWQFYVYLIIAIGVMKLLLKLVTFNL